MNKDFIKFLMPKIDFPEEAQTEFCRVFDVISANAVLSELFDDAVRFFYTKEGDCCTSHFSNFGDIIARACDENTYTVQMLLLLAAAEKLYADYKAQGVDEEIYFLSMRDLRAKLIECKNCKGVWGTFVTGWFGRFYEMTRFALGRFQFEQIEFDYNYEKNGYKVGFGDTVYNMHIPSHPIPLTDEVRLDSLKRAYKFYKKPGDNTPIVFVCHSWLLWPRYYDALPEGSNIRKFQDDFDIYSSEEYPRFSDAWRVFNDKADLPYAEWPEDTKLRRYLKKYFVEGGKPGAGSGIIIFDGEKILNK